MRDRLRMAVYPDGSDGKHAVTHYRVLKRYGYVTLVECRLDTGRTHQIRVHMEYIGHPLFNDERYGGDRILKGTTFAKYKQFIDNCFSVMPRHALHARSLGFEHPSTRRRMEFDSELPADFRAVLDKWDAYTAARPAEEDLRGGPVRGFLPADRGGRPLCRMFALFLRLSGHRRSVRRSAAERFLHGSWRRVRTYRRVFV